MIVSYCNSSPTRELRRGDCPKKRFPRALCQAALEALAALAAATTLDDLRSAGWRLHRLERDLKGFWSISFSGAWRIIFRWDPGIASDVCVVDYH